MTHSVDYTEDDSESVALAPFSPPRIYEVYYFTGFFYVLPFIFLFLFILDQMTFELTEMLFWVLFLVSLVPCGVIGFVLSLIGFSRAGRLQDAYNRRLGIAGLALGSFGLLAGLFGFALLVVVLSS